MKQIFTNFELNDIYLPHQQVEERKWEGQFLHTALQHRHGQTHNHYSPVKGMPHQRVDAFRSQLVVPAGHHEHIEVASELPKSIQREELTDQQRQDSR